MHQYCTATLGSLLPNSPGTQPNEYSHISAASEIILERRPCILTLITIVSLNIQFSTCLLIPICNLKSNFCKHTTIGVIFYFNQEPFSILEQTSSVQMIFHYRTGWFLQNHFMQECASCFSGRNLRIPDAFKISLFQIHGGYFSFKMRKMHFKILVHILLKLCSSVFLLKAFNFNFNQFFYIPEQQ